MAKSLCAVPPAQSALQLEFDFEFNCPFIEAEYYRDGAQDIIQKILPPVFRCQFLISC